MAPGTLEVVLVTMANPAAGLGLVTNKVATRCRRRSDWPGVPATGSPNAVPQAAWRSALAVGCYLSRPSIGREKVQGTDAKSTKYLENGAQESSFRSRSMVYYE